MYRHAYKTHSFIAWLMVIYLHNGFDCIIFIFSYVGIFNESLQQVLPITSFVQATMEVKWCLEVPRKKNWSYVKSKCIGSQVIYWSSSTCQKTTKRNDFTICKMGLRPNCSYGVVYVSLNSVMWSPVNESHVTPPSCESNIVFFLWHTLLIVILLASSHNKVIVNCLLYAVSLQRSFKVTSGHNIWGFLNLQKSRLPIYFSMVLQSGVYHQLHKLKLLKDHQQRRYVTTDIIKRTQKPVVLDMNSSVQTIFILCCNKFISVAGICGRIMLLCVFQAFNQDFSFQE